MKIVIDPSHTIYGYAAYSVEYQQFHGHFKAIELQNGNGHGSHELIIFSRRPKMSELGKYVSFHNLNENLNENRVIHKGVSCVLPRWWCQ